MEPLQTMNIGPELTKIMSEVLVMLLQLTGAIARVGSGDPEAATKELTAFIQDAPVSRYSNEALYWRARILERQNAAESRGAAVRDYVEIIRRVPSGELRRLSMIRLASLSEPGVLLKSEEAREASMKNLTRIGEAMHDFAADHNGRLPDTIDELLDDYLSSALTLVQPGAPAAGGGTPYLYQRGLLADIGVTKLQSGEKAKLAAGVPVIAWEASPASDGRRLALRLDGEVMVIRTEVAKEPLPE